MKENNRIISSRYVKQMWSEQKWEHIWCICLEHFIDSCRNTRIAQRVQNVFDSDQDVDLAAELESAEAFERQGDDKTHGKGDEKAEMKNKQNILTYNTYTTMKTLIYLKCIAS